MMVRTLLLTALLASCSDSDAPRCPVCGMNPAQYPRWRASAELTDGTKVEFDSPKCLLRFVGDPGRHRRGARLTDRSRIRAVEYYSQRSMDARSLLWVQGSDVVGPMGPDYVPVRSRDQARQFLADHSGKKILTYEEAVRSPP